MLGKRNLSASSIVGCDDLSEALRRAEQGKERVVIKRRRKPIAALIPMEDLRLLEQLEDQMDARDFRAAWESAKREGFKPLERVLRRLGIEA
jgi:prevent-host-death family protein